MCGLIGLISTEAAGIPRGGIDMLKQGLFADTVRGEDGTGVCSVTRQGVVTLKKSAIAGPEFIRDPVVRQLLSVNQSLSVLMGHNRKATVHGNPMLMAHPFRYNGIVLTHNGTLTDQRELVQVSKSDSHNLAATLSAAENDQDKITNILAGVRGAYALAWYHIESRTMFFARNLERPLTIGIGGQVWNDKQKPSGKTLMYASEGPMLAWLAWRNRMMFAADPIYIDPFTLYKVDLKSNKGLVEQLLEVKAYEVKPTPIFHHVPGNTAKTMEKNGVAPAVHTASAKYIKAEEKAKLECGLTIGDAVYTKVTEVSPFVTGKDHKQVACPDVVVYGATNMLLKDDDAPIMTVMYGLQDGSCEKGDLMEAEILSITLDTSGELVLWLDCEWSFLSPEVVRSDSALNNKDFTGPSGKHTLTKSDFAVKVRFGCSLCESHFDFKEMGNDITWSPLDGACHTQCFKDNEAAAEEIELLMEGETVGEIAVSANGTLEELYNGESF